MPDDLSKPYIYTRQRFKIKITHENKLVYKIDDIK